MCENCDFVVPVNILTPFAHALFSCSAQHTTVSLDFILSNFFVLPASLPDSCG